MQQWSRHLPLNLDFIVVKGESSKWPSEFVVLVHAASGTKENSWLMWQLPKSNVQLLKSSPISIKCLLFAFFFCLFFFWLIETTSFWCKNSRCVGALLFVAGDKPHKCEVCNKCFSRKDKLKMHMRSHTGVKPYKCKHCDYAAADSSSLNKHQRIHSNERPFKCQICPYASRNSSQLTVHLRSHTGKFVLKFRFRFEGHRGDFSRCTGVKVPERAYLKSQKHPGIPVLWISWAQSLTGQYSSAKNTRKQSEADMTLGRFSSKLILKLPIRCSQTSNAKGSGGLIDWLRASRCLSASQIWSTILETLKLLCHWTSYISAKLNCII